MSVELNSYEICTVFSLASDSLITLDNGHLVLQLTCYKALVTANQLNFWARCTKYYHRFLRVLIDVNLPLVSVYFHANSLLPGHVVCVIAHFNFNSNRSFLIQIKQRYVGCRFRVGYSNFCKKATVWDADRLLLQFTIKLMRTVKWTFFSL